MIYFGLGAVMAMYWFIAGALFEHLRGDIMAMENEWERFVAFYLGVVFWPLGILVGLWVGRHPQFKPQSWHDWALIPWWYLRYALAWCWTEGWRLCLKVRHWRLRGTKQYRWVTNPGHGRHTDPHPVMCPICLWAGPVRWLKHGYAACGEDDVEPVDECPRCGYEL